MLLSTTFNTSTCEPPRFLCHNAILANYNVSNSKIHDNEPITVRIFVKLTCFQYIMTCSISYWSMCTIVSYPNSKLYRTCQKRRISPPESCKITLFPPLYVLHTGFLYAPSKIEYKHQVILQLCDLSVIMNPFHCIKLCS